MLGNPIALISAEDFELFAPDVSDEALEAAAGDARGLFCSCGGCNSACTNGSQ